MQRDLPRGVPKHSSAQPFRQVDQQGNARDLRRDIGNMSQPAHLSQALAVVCGHNDNTVVVQVLLFQKFNEGAEGLVYLLDGRSVLVIESGMRSDRYLLAVQRERERMHIRRLSIEEDWMLGVFSLEQVAFKFIDDHAEF